ncbi:MAG: glycosyltransferase family 4 protein [Actinomycetota bacterium]|nr:glycosyltransferase family 4 protein [Actinomycetota bacterium]
MLVLHVQETPPGGVVNYLKELTGEQVRRDHQVHLLSPAPQLGWPGVAHHCWALDRKRPTGYPRGLAQFVRVARQLRPDVIHLHSFWAGQFGRAPTLSRLVKAPIVYQPHAWTVGRFPDPRFQRLVWAAERRASRSTRVVVANCWDEIAEGRKAGIDTPGREVGVPLDTERFNTAAADARATHRAELKLNGPRVVLCLGRITRQKGQDQLIAAWEAQPIPDTELVFVGTGDVSELRKLAPTQWGKTVRAFPAQADVRPWIWACDVLVQPSRYETVGLSIAEAMSCGRPVVATRANGVADAVGEVPGEAGGAVVTLGAMDQLLKECSRRLNDPQLWEAESKQGRRRAEQRFTPSAVVDHLDRAYVEAQQALDDGVQTPLLPRGSDH